MDIALPCAAGRDRNSATLAFPWAGMKWLANGRPLSPREGGIWKIFFGRFEKLQSAGVEIDPHGASVSVSVESVQAL